MWKKNIRKKIIVVAWLLLWQLAAYIVNNPIFFVGPIEVAGELIRLLPKLYFWQTLGLSLARILSGFVMAFTLAFLLALWAYRHEIVEEIFEPVVQVIKSVPVASVVVLLLIWFGSKHLALYITMMVVFPNIYVQMLTGLKHADKKLLEMARVYRIPSWNLFLYVLRPAFMPYLISGVKVALGMSFKSGVAAEIIGLPEFSIGEAIYSDKIYLNTAGVFAWTLMLIFLSVVVEKGVLFLLKRLAEAEGTPWIQHQDNKLVAEDIVFYNVTKRYGKQEILKDFSGTFEAGKSYCIMGESGSGKTTLLHMLAGLLPWEEGKIEGIGKIQRGMVFQENRLCEEISAKTNIQLIGCKIEEANIQRYLDKLLPTEAKEKTVKEYSGGMKRRVALVRAMISEGTLLLLDEPFTGLDEENKKRAMDFIVEHQRGRTLIFTSHDQADGEKLGAEVIWLKKQVAQATMERELS